MSEDLRLFLAMIGYVAIAYHLGNLLSAMSGIGSPLDEALRRKACPMDEAALEAALDEARGRALKREFLRDLADCRRRYGHDGLRNGHLWWIRERLAGRPVPCEPPSFAEAEIPMDSEQPETPETWW